MKSIQYNWQDIGLWVVVFGWLPMVLSEYLIAITPWRITWSTSGIKMAQLIFCVSLVVFGIFQLLFGILSDKLGRRNILLTGFVCYEIALMCEAFGNKFSILGISYSQAEPYKRWEVP